MTPDAVQKEARMLNTVDHDGMFVFHFMIFQTTPHQQRKFLPCRQVKNCLQIVLRGILTLQHAQRQNCLFIERKLSVIEIWNQIFQTKNKLKGKKRLNICMSVGEGQGLFSTYSIGKIWIIC